MIKVTMFLLALGMIFGIAIQNASACRMLVLAYDTFGANAEEDRFAWKLGHVIDIKPNDHEWGGKEGMPKFMHVDVPGMTVDECLEYTTPRIDFSDINNPTPIGIRKYKMNINNVPAAKKSGLLLDGAATFTDKKAINFFDVIQDR